MELETLNCNNCGSPLEVPEVANFVTCNYCESKLAIRRTASTTYTEQLDSIEAKQDELLQKVDALERANRAVILDRNWDRQKQSFMITDNKGRERLPSEGGAIGSFVGVGFGLFFAFIAGGIFPPMAFFGIIFACIAGFSGMHQLNKTDEYRRAKRDYKRERRSILKGPVHDPNFHGIEEIPTPEEYLARLEQTEH